MLITSITFMCASKFTFVNSFCLFMTRHIFLVFFYYTQETLLVHKDLVQTGGLNELTVDLRTEGRDFPYEQHHCGYVIRRASNFTLFHQYISSKTP